MEFDYQDDEEPRKRRKIVLDDEDEDEVGSNPDERIKENNSDEEDGEDLYENWIEDYAPAPELDYYDPSMLAKDDDEELFESYEKRVRDRLAAEEELDAMDERRRTREMEVETRLVEFNTFQQNEIDVDEFESELADDGAEKALNLEKFECPLREWISEERTRREIQRRLKLFLTTFQITENDQKGPRPNKKQPYYQAKIRTMCANNSSSLEVSYNHITEFQPLLAIWLIDVPREILQIFDEVLKQVVLEGFSFYTNIAHETHIRIIDLPMPDKLRDLRQGDLNNLVRVPGVVTRRTGVFPQMLSVVYDCTTCGRDIGPFRLNGGDMKPEMCPYCEARGPFRVNQSKTKYGNYQKLTLQETPGTVPPGRVPRYKDVVLLGDLIDIARPGEEVEITGIYTHSQQSMARRSNGFPVFSTIIEANSIQKKYGGSDSSWTDDERRQILEMAKDPKIGERIIQSIAPSIYGHRHVKTAIALALFGGVQKEGGSGSGMHRVRGDVNVLLLGDPGTAKSQILKYAEKTAPRAVYTTGKGASAVGLTAGVHKDPMTKEWTLEGGALVLADQGVCLIDEFDKMNDQDRTSIHEAMEQQTISVSKAGIVTSLQARCSVIAAANPIGGRYDSSYSFAENVELTDPILQRFDILCVLQDVVDPIVDEKLANFVINSHMKSHPNKAASKNSEPQSLQPMEEEKTSSLENDIGNSDSIFNTDSSLLDDPQPIPQDLLKKYIAYAKTQVKPILHDLDLGKLSSLYSDLRLQSNLTGGVPIAVRHLESIVRMAEGSARMHLRDHVRTSDVDLAIKVMLESFIQAQKISVRRNLQHKLMKYITYGEDTNLLLLYQLQTMIIDVEKFKSLTNDKSPITEVYIEALETRAKELNIFDLRPFYQSKVFREHGLILDTQKKVIRKVY